MIKPQTNLSRLIEIARGVKMSESQRAEQRNSFVYGNTRTENPDITRQMVDEVGKDMSSEEADPAEPGQRQAGVRRRS